MSEFHEGGCVCGAVRYRVNGDPQTAYVCHCTFCQRRTGSAFAVIVWFEEENVELMGNGPTIYEHRVDENNRWFRLHFLQPMRNNRHGNRRTPTKPSVDYGRHTRRPQLGQVRSTHLDAFCPTLDGLPARYEALREKRRDRQGFEWRREIGSERAHTSVILRQARHFALQADHML